MAIDPQVVFRVMHCAYRNGVLDKIMSIQGRALELVMEETGADMGDLLNRLDEASEETVMKVDGFLDRAGPFLRCLHNDGLMRLVGRLLSVSSVRVFVARRMADSIKRTLTGEPAPSLPDKMRAVVSRARRAA